MTAPRTYAEWCAALDALAAGGDDGAVIEHMAAGEIRWSDGVAQRLTDQFGRAFETRLRTGSTGLQNALKRARDDADLSRALTDMRRTFALLHRVASLPAIPVQLGDMLKSVVANAAKQMTDSLLTSAQADRTGRLAAAVRRTSLLQFAEVGEPRTGPEAPPGMRRARTILS